MLARALTLFFFSSQVWSAGISIELETAVTIGSFEYVESEWLELDIDPELVKSFKYRIINYSGDRPQVLIEHDNSTLEMAHKSEQMLTSTRVTNWGEVSTFDYPEVSNYFDHYVQIGTVPYILDEVDDTVLAWDAESEYWKDLSLSLDMPEGDYTDIQNLSGNLIVSTLNESDAELWRIGIPLYQLGNTAESPNAKITYSPLGYMQISSVDGQYTINWVEQNIEPSVLPISSSEASYLFSASTDSGTLSLFRGSEVLFTWSDENGHRKVSPPSNTENIFGCYFSSYPHLFCAIETNEGDTILYEVIDGEFVADTKFSLNGTSEEVTGILAIGSKRYVTTRVIKSSVTRYFINLVKGDELIRLTGFDVVGGSNDDNFFMFKSKTEGAFYWLGITSSEYTFAKIEHEGDLEFVANSVDGSRAEGILKSSETTGRFSFYVLCLMLLTLSARKTKFN